MRYGFTNTGKARLTQSWYSLQKKRTRTPPTCFLRGSLLRSRLALHRVTFFCIGANKHFVRNLSHVLGVQKSIMLSNAYLTCKIVQDMVLNVYGETEMAKKEKRTVTGHALVAPDWSGRKHG